MWMLGPDIGGLDVAVVDAEGEDQAHFGDEQQAEEEREPAQRFLTAFFERQVVDLIDRGAEREKRRQHENADENRIDAEIDVDEIGEIGAEDDKGGMRDVDDVEHAERNRNAGGDGGIEGPEQQSGDNCVD